MMPGMNGYEVCSVIKSEEASRDIPVIFLTARADSSDIVKGFEIGGQDYITKPFNAKELLARVQTHLTIRRMQKDLIDQNEELKKINDEKNQILGIAAHDLRNPLATIMGYIEFLGYKFKSDEEIKRIFDLIYNSSKYMSSLLEEILDIAAIQSGKIHLSFEKCDIANIIQNISDVNSMISSKKNIKIEFVSDNSISNFITYIDKNKFNQILNNLLSNAIKFSPFDTTIRLELEKKEDRFIVIISDQGQGIPEKEQGRLFKPFAKISTKGTAGEKSTGLGLAIVKRIVETLGGDISFKSKEKEGTSFRVELPLVNSESELNNNYNNYHVIKS